MLKTPSTPSGVSKRNVLGTSIEFWTQSYQSAKIMTALISAGSTDRHIDFCVFCSGSYRRHPIESGRNCLEKFSCFVQLHDQSYVITARNYRPCFSAPYSVEPYRYRQQHRETCLRDRNSFVIVRLKGATANASVELASVASPRAYRSNVEAPPSRSCSIPNWANRSSLFLSFPFRLFVDCTPIKTELRPQVGTEQPKPTTVASVTRLFRFDPFSKKQQTSTFFFNFYNFSSSCYYDRTWNINVSLYRGFGWARFKPVFDRSISWPLLSTRASFTYVSGGFVSFPPPPRKWDPLIISTDKRPVVPLYAKPIRISATLPPFILLP